MMVASFFRMLTALLLASVPPADVERPLLKASLTKHVSPGVNNLVQHSQQRVQNLRAKVEGRDVSASDSVINSPVKNVAVSYTASVGVGNPATQCK